jgi:phosphatidylglycerophosphate synthase
MRKIPNEYENPIDNYIINAADYIVPTIYKGGFDPNTITSLSSITCIIVIILLFQANYYLAAFFLIVSYFFDCLDGHLARSYNMVTVFGDYYDHISDFLKIFFVLLTLYYINSTKFFKIFPIFILITILMIVHFGCQELYYNSSESQTLEFTKILCPVNDKNNITQVTDAIKLTKYFGCGTMYASLVISIIYYAY